MYLANQPANYLAWLLPSFTFYEEKGLLVTCVARREKRGMGEDENKICMPAGRHHRKPQAYCELKYLDLDDYDLDFSSNGVQRGFFLYYYLPGAHLELPCSLMCPTYVCMRCS